MNKADKDKVIAALKYATETIKYQNEEDSIGFHCCCDVLSYEPHHETCEANKALTIMRGLAEDAEPVAICAVTPQGEVSIGWRHGYKPRHNENLYTSPQAAQTDEREAFEAEFDQLCKDYSIYGTMDARLCKVFFEAGRAERKG